MAKTTIDGLRVREPSNNRSRANAVHQSRHTIDMTTRRASDNTDTARQRREMLDSIETVKKKRRTANSFLDPVETFDFDAEPVSRPSKRFDEGAEADWSELLSMSDELNEPVEPIMKALPAGTVEKTHNTSVRKSSRSSNAGRRDSNEFLESWGDESDQSDFLSQNAAISELMGDDEEEEEDLPRPRKHKKHHKKLHVGRMVAIIAVCLIVVAGGVFYKWGDELISRLTGGNSGLWDAIISVVSDEVPFETDINGRTNVLIFGTEGYNMSGDTDFGTHDGAQLTDSIMIASFDQETKDVALISLPRDLKVSMACSAGKINEVFWCHNKDGDNETAGAQALMEQVGDILGLQFQYYAHINWASLIDIIDTLGGITVTLDENIADYNYTGAVAQAGVPIEVNGEQALGLARARHGTMGGDFTRGNTQQKIVEAIVSKLLSNGVGPSEALNLLGILGDNLRSNFSTDNIKAGVRLLAGFNIGNIRQIPLVDYETETYYVTTATINDISYVVPSAGTNNYSAIKKYVAEALKNDPVAREQARIAVYNASGRFGVAAAERDRLIEDEYSVVSIGDAELDGCVEQYCVYAVNEGFEATKQRLAERYGVNVMEASELPEDIILGEVDFVIVLGMTGDAV